MGNITGQNFREWVNNQITIRQQKLGATQKDADNVAWQTNSTAWLRLCSSVNVSREKSKELTGTENNSGAELAKKYVLFGGVNSSSSNWDPKSGVLSSPYTALNSNVYGFDSDESRALVPMPGLISATVTPMNRGALKKAQIRIKCHSQEQFAILDSLYMRPGYTILLEWGHTMYFDNSGNLVSTPEFNTPAYENIINRKGTQDDILKNIDTERSSTDGNYDGFFGKITNFDWSFQTDGTYDITVNAISIGDVIETLNINNASFKATSNVAKGENDDTADSNEEAVIGDFIANKDKSQLNNWLYYLYNKLGERTKQGVGTTKGYSGSNSSTYTSSYSKIFFRKSFTGGKSKREAIRVNNKVLPSEEGGSVIIEEASYIRLGALLKYIQDYLLIYSNKDGKKTPYLKIDWDYSTNYCFTFPEQYSVDPTVCVIPFKQPFSKNGKYIHGKYGVIWENLLGNAFRDTKSDFVGKLMNIHINFNFIDTCIQNNLNQGELALLAFLESLMKGVQRALGDVNKFSVTYDGEENSIKIYDEIPLDPKVTGKKGELALFNTFGVKENLAGSFITNITLNATISSEFATMISIGAQARNDGKKANTSTLTRFNEGLVDGIIPTKLTERVASSSQDEEKTFDEVYTDSYKKVWKAGSILLDFYWKNNKPTKEGTDTEYSVMSELFRTLAANYNKKNGVGGIEGFLPFNLGLEMKGLSGPRIYEKYFITGEILPNSYPKNLAFLVKGLQHDINLEGWKTTIDSMAYQSVGEYVALPPTKEQGSGGENNNGNGGQNDPNAEYKTITSGYTIENGPNGPFYFADKTSDKTQITIHYTAGGPSVSGPIRTWNKSHAENGFHIATHYVLGGDGSIELVFPLENYANHTGVGGRSKNKFNVGIEVCNYGYGYPERWLETKGRADLVDKNGESIEAWRGKENYEPMSTAQIQSLKKILLEIKASYPDIPLTFNYDECFPGDGTSAKAIGLTPGVYTHNSFKPKGQKFDVPPQRELIDMLKTL